MAEFRIRGGTKLAEFITSNRKVDVIQGPIGSGKTRAMMARIMRHIQQQRISTRTGRRMSRWAVVRNTYPMLRDTTIKSWLEIAPEEAYGRINRASPSTHRLRFVGGDGVEVEAEVIFLALDDTSDIVKLRSNEFTGIAWNELPFIQKDLFDEAGSRLRYPGPEHGGSAWHGMIADANAPDEDHWLAVMTGQVPLPPNLTDAEQRELEWPSLWGLYMQPPAVLETRNEHGVIVGYTVNPESENLQNLRSEYYDDALRAKSKAWIDSRLRNVVTLVVDGHPVWPMFRREFHVAQSALRPVPGHDVLVWLDFGRVYPAALFAQEISQRIYVQHEILGFNEPASRFAPRVKRFLEQNYPGYSFRAVGDPKGRDGGQQTDESSYDIFASVGIPVDPAPVKRNNIEARTEAVAFALNDNPSGVPRLTISPVCRTLIVGMAGRYHLTKEESGDLKPKKDKYSNLCDCLQYGCIGIGEGQRMIGSQSASTMKPARVYKGRQTRRRGVPLPDGPHPHQ